MRRPLLIRWAAALYIVALRASPFHWLNIIWRAIPRDTTVLDVGCGNGRVMWQVGLGRSLKAVGLDGYRPYLEMCVPRQSHRDCIQADVRRLPFRPRSFDVVLCLDVLEYLSQSEGEQLLNSLEQIATRRVIVATPLGTGSTFPDGEDRYMQRVRSTWSVEDFLKRGYRIRGDRFPFEAGDRGIRSDSLRRAFALAHIVTGVIPFFFPRFAGHAVCVKNVVQG